MTETTRSEDFENKDTKERAERVYHFFSYLFEQDTDGEFKNPTNDISKIDLNERSIYTPEVMEEMKALEETGENLKGDYAIFIDGDGHQNREKQDDSPWTKKEVLEAALNEMKKYVDYLEGEAKLIAQGTILRAELYLKDYKWNPKNKNEQ